MADNEPFLPKAGIALSSTSNDCSLMLTMSGIFPLATTARNLRTSGVRPDPGGFRRLRRTGGRAGHLVMPGARRRGYPRRLAGIPVRRAGPAVIGDHDLIWVGGQGTESGVSLPNHPNYTEQSYPQHDVALLPFGATLCHRSHRSHRTLTLTPTAQRRTRAS